jgi:DNA-binding IclR family transcriptional regulator
MWSPVTSSIAVRDPAATCDGGIKSVMSALQVLDCFASQEERGVSDIARWLGVAKSSAHRILTTLCANRLVEQNTETKQYRLGLHLYELGELARERRPWHAQTLPLLEQLRQASGHTVHLTIADGTDVLFLERLETLPGISLMSGRARRQPSHCTSAGKAIAAFDPAVAAARRLAGFPRMTPRSIGSPPDYEAALASTRKHGYAVSDGEARLGLASVAAPICDRAGRAHAAVSVLGPSERVLPRVERDARLVVLIADKISRVLGL